MIRQLHCADNLEVLDAAQRLGLGWIGIDLSSDAIALTQSRLRALGADFEVHGAATAAPPDGKLF